MSNVIDFKTAATRKAEKEKANRRKNYKFKTDISLDDALNCLYRFLLAMKLVHNEDEFMNYNCIYQEKIRSFLWESGVMPEEKGGVRR